MVLKLEQEMLGNNHMCDNNSQICPDCAKNSIRTIITPFNVTVSVVRAIYVVSIDLKGTRT